LELRNTGQVTLTAVHAITSSPLSTDCGTTATLAPGAVHACTLTATVIQDDFDLGDVTLAVNATAGHLGSLTRTLAGTLSYSSSISLNDTASMDLVVAADGAVTKAGQSEHHKLITFA
jgi:hypothetical protein